MKRIILISLLFIICRMVFPANDRFVVVIDPGHGGRDAGAVRGSYKEKDINLGVALALGEFIENNMKDVKVVYTRKADAFVALDRRAEIANKAKANLFISIHTNSTAAKKTTAQGADTYILGLSRTEENLAVAKRENSVIMLEDDYTTKYEGFDPNSPESYIIFEFMTNKYRDQSLDFAGYIQRDFRNVAKRADRGVREAGFLVLRKTSMPSVLIELGFINNDNEAKFLSTKSGQRIMATAIFSGFKEYKKNFDKMQGKVDPNAGKANVVQAPKSKPKSNQSIQKERPKEEAQLTNNTPLVKETSPVVEPKKEPVEQIAEAKKDDPKNVIVTQDRVAESVISEVKNESKPSSPRKDIVDPPKDAIKNRVIDLRNDGVEYRVQFLYSGYKLPPNSPEFKGLSPVEYYEDNGYKYTYGLTDNLKEIERIQTEVRQKFKDAFVIKQDKENNPNRKFIPVGESQQTTYNVVRTKKEPAGTASEKVKESKKQSEVKVPAIKKDEIEYRVQFLISPNKLPDNSGAFKGLSPVQHYVDNGYKYTFGSSTSMVEIQKIQTQVRKKFKDAFIVKFKNGERIK